MFLRFLNESQKRKLIELVVNLAKYDDFFHEKEKEFIELLCHEAEIEYYPDSTNNIDMENIKEIFNDEKSKNILLVELISLAYYDLEFSEKEKSFIQNIAKKLDVENKKVEILSDWARDLISLLNRGRELINL